MRSFRSGLSFLVAPALLASGGIAHAGEAPRVPPAVQRCNAEAARPAPGVTVAREYDQLDVARALAVCGAALRQFPDNAAVLANIGRAHVKARDYAAALPVLRRAVDLGNPQAMFSLASMLGDGNGVDKDPARQIALLRRAIEAGYPGAYQPLADAYQEGSGVPKDPVEAVRLLRLGAEAGDRFAVNDLGAAYADGTGVAQDHAEARRLYARAADLGNAMSNRNLGWLLKDGQGGPVDPTGALAAFRRAAEGGDAPAMQTLGDLLVGVEKGYPTDLAEAKRWFLAAGAAGNADGYTSLGYHIASGHGFAPSTAEAAGYYKQGAEAGSAWGWRNLAHLQAAGNGVPTDLAAAIEGYRKAADLGDVLAMIELGERYALGKGVPFDLVESTRWYRQASDTGNARGMKEYADLLMAGRGVGRDVPAALALYEKAGEDYPTAYTALGDYYALGTEVPADGARAQAYYLKAVEKGDAAAKFEVANKYADGQFLPQRSDKARGLYEEALAEGQTAATQPLVRILLAGDAAEKARGLDLVHRAADRNEGWALAALAHPGPVLAPLLAPGESQRWHDRLAAVRDTDTLIDVAFALKTGRIPEQSFGLATGYAQRSGDALAAKQFELQLMEDLGMGAAAFDQFVKFLDSDAYRKAEPRRQRALAETFDVRHRYDVTEENLAKVLRLADMGLRDAASSAGWFLVNKDSPAPDPVRGLALLEKARELGSASSIVSLGTYKVQQAKTAEEAEAGMALWRIGAERGNVVAAKSIGIDYGLDVNPAYYGPGKRNAFAPAADPAQAFHYIRLAANQYDYQAMVMLAVMYLRGEGTEKDVAEAMRLLRIAIHCGENSGRIVMARAYLDGVGVVRDPAQALRWFRLAADYNQDSGNFGLDWMVRASVHGWGMKPDAREARAWLARAVKRDSISGKAWLAGCGADATLACLRRQPGMAVPVLGPPTLDPAPLPGFAEREAVLTRAVDDAIARDGSSFAVFDADGALQQHYLLYRRYDKLLPLLLRGTLMEDARLSNLYGGQPNYFALIGSSCRWSQASKAARMAGKPEAALFFAKIAVNRLQDARQRIADLDEDIRECFLKVHHDRYRALADLFMEMGRYGEAEHVLAMLKDFENLTYARGGEPKGKALDRMPFDAAQEASYLAIEKAVAALSEAGSARTRLHELRDEEGTLTPAQEAELAAANTALQSANAAFDTGMADLRTRVAALDTQGRTDDTRTRVTRVEAVKGRLQELVRQMGPDTVALHAVVLPDRVHWLLTTPTFQKAIPIPLDEGELRKLVGAYREALTMRSPDAPARATALYAAVFAPVDAALKRTGAHNVMLSLDDCLRYVPFAGLNDGKDWLVRRYAFTEFQKAEDVLVGGSGRKKWRVAGFGATQGGAGFSPLPAVARELEGIVRDPVVATTDGAAPADPATQGVLPGIRKLDAAFDRTALTAAMADSFPVLHIASHFKLDPTGKAQSQLLLGDGTTLSLKEFGVEGGLRFQGLDLLALSACETALAGSSSNGAEVDSMAVTAQNLGAAAVLASLWSVNDASTAQLMQAFYRAKSGGATKADSLRAAQLAMLDTAGADTGASRGTTLGGGAPKSGPSAAGFAHPFFWAPFILLGNGT